MITDYLTCEHKNIYYRIQAGTNNDEVPMSRQSTQARRSTNDTQK